MFGTCSNHVWNAQVTKNRGRIKKYDKKNKEKIGKDFEAYKRSPWVQPLVTSLKIREKKIATTACWLKQCGPAIHTRIELNDSNFLRDGSPVHNINSEGTNNNCKKIVL